MISSIESLASFNIWLPVGWHMKQTAVFTQNVSHGLRQTQRQFQKLYGKQVGLERLRTCKMPNQQQD
ncbi:hypothetical protein R1sor_008157 [Riccia sorocarpa]|uniref:Uncharacterized protein n=1 Tax=Riccia sorocarpa TaxID=122646 RepID=A0ABD3HUR5_9MARC